MRRYARLKRFARLRGPPPLQALRHDPFQHCWCFDHQIACPSEKVVYQFEQIAGAEANEQLDAIASAQSCSIYVVDVLIQCFIYVA